jgi:ribonuclease BN (tRNA processing enzyme)
MAIIAKGGIQECPAPSENKNSMEHSGRHLSRRAVLGTLLAVPALALPQPPAPSPNDPSLESREAEVRAALKDAKGTKLVLLGTGAGPLPGQNRRMQSSVLVHNGVAYLVDCGLGVTDLYARTGIPFSSVRSIFITHHHPDHNVEYGPFLIIGWIQGLKQSVTAFGPTPLTQMTENYMESMKVTIDFWAEDFKRTPLRAIACTELSKEGHVMQDENVKVSSVLVQHPPVRPAYGYRFDFPDRAIAFSGDTVPLEAVARLAKSADVLVHEAMDVPATEEMVRRQSAASNSANFDAMMNHMRVDHTPSEDVGRIAQEAGVKTLVLSHLTPSLSALEPPDSRWVQGASKHFKGQIIIGHDLMVI